MTARYRIRRIGFVLPYEVEICTHRWFRRLAWSRLGAFNSLDEAEAFVRQCIEENLPRYYPEDAAP